MLKEIMIVALSLVISSLMLFASPDNENSPEKKSCLELINSKSDSFEFINKVGEISTINVKTKIGDFVKLNIPGYAKSTDYGMPELPEISRLIEIPYGAKASIEIISYDQEVIYLESYGLDRPLMPVQPSVSKSVDIETVEFQYNAEFYKSGQVYAPEVVLIENAGIMRGVNIARLVINPFEYNTDDNSLIIKNNLRVKISFEGGDYTLTDELKTKYFSSHFNVLYSNIWNFKTPDSKDALSNYPINYVIVSDPMFEDALQEFIEWKKKKGFYVIEAYTDNPEVGTTTTSIKAYLENLYLNATAENPAPSYVLFVGDVAQIPVFDSENSGSSNHITDMYYCEMDGGSDYIPDMYFGRFSAQNVNQLLPQIHKTLQFEMFSIPNPAYLENVVMVAGVDGSFGDSHANGQINYGTNEYFNAEHGITASIYHYPESGNSEAAILADISAGAGYVNYTAHCSQDGWGDPSFTSSDIPNLNNEDMYYVGVSNCCLSNKFEVDCFGEELLRAENEGAVAHLGGSNSTLWDEDFYWSVGLSSNINSNPTYEETGIGAYDALFHENGEDPYITTAQMNFIGNMAVQASSSSNKLYYWEIYHVMGDPSLMPYLGIPTELNVNYLNPQPMGVTNLTVTTEEDAYVALSLNGVILDVQLADETGVVELEFESINEVTNVDLVITKQNRQPFIGVLEIIPNDNDYDVQLSGINTPETTIHRSNANFQPEVKIRNLGQLNLTQASLNYQINNQAIVSETWTGSLETFEEALFSFPEISLMDGNYTFKAWAVEPNGEIDEFPQNDTLSMAFSVYSGDAGIVSIQAPIDMNCNVVELAPEITIVNNDAFNLTSLTVGYVCGDLSDEIEWTGELGMNQEAQVLFDTQVFPEGLQEIQFYIENPNSGLDIDGSDNEMSKEFRVTIGETVQIDLLTDAYAEETSWDLVEDITEDILYQNGNLSNNTHHISEWCLGEGCYTFTIYDSYGDGMAGSWWGETDPGEVVLTNLDNGIVYGTISDDFGSEESIKFCIGSELIILTPNELEFGDVVTGESAELSYDILGIDLSEDIQITVSENFEISLTSGSGYTNSLSIPVTDENVEETIFVKFSPDTEMPYTGTISHVSGDSERALSLAGNGVVGIDGEWIRETSVYPNPSTGIVHIESKHVNSIEIIDQMGRVILRQNMENENLNLDMTEYPNAVYMLKLISDKGTYLTRIRIVK
jgi:hypothetical protein